MEPHVSVASADSSGKITVWASTQGPFAIRSGIAGTLGIPLTQINVIGTTMGGGLVDVSGLLSHTFQPYCFHRKQGARFRVQMTREEEFTDGRPAPGCVIKTENGGIEKTGVSSHDRHSLFGILDPSLGHLSVARFVSVGSIRFPISR